MRMYTDANTGTGRTSVTISYTHTNIFTGSEKKKKGDKRMHIQRERGGILII